MTKYVAFLRGINVGGNKKVPMSELKKVFESLGFTDVKTLLNSGNVVFESGKGDAETLEKELEKKFGFQINLILRTFEELKKLADSNPFKGISLSPDTRFYVTFLYEKIKNSFISPDKNLKILKASSSEICFVLSIKPGFGTTEAMGILEKEFGKKVTTRNWNTVVKIAGL